VTTPDLAATFRAPFRAQIAALRLRLGNRLPTAVWTDLDRAAHERAFTVAGALKADLLADLAEAVGRAIEEGRGIEWFRTEFRRIVEARGWHGWTGEGTAKGEAWRTKVIYRTNVLTSYASGRMAQLQEAGYRFWIYRHGGSIEPRIQHLGWDGLILPPTDAFWRTHAPPNGWGCRCRIRGAYSLEGAVRKGGRPGLEPPPGYNTPDPRTGAPPGIDKGWDYAVGASVAGEVAAAARLIERKAGVLPPPLGSAFVESAPDVVEAGWTSWLSQIAARREGSPGLLGALSREVLAALEARDIAVSTAELLVQPGIVVGRKSLRHGLAEDALDPETWARMPTLIRAPSAVLFDRRSENLIYILPASGDRRTQLAVTVDYSFRKEGITRKTNMVVSAYQPRLTDLLGRVAGGLLEVLFGKLG
jgi:hypothetical protein